MDVYDIHRDEMKLHPHVTVVMLREADLKSGFCMACGNNQPMFGECLECGSEIVIPVDVLLIRFG